MTVLAFCGWIAAHNLGAAFGAFVGVFALLIYTARDAAHFQSTRGPYAFFATMFAGFVIGGLTSAAIIALTGERSWERALAAVAPRFGAVADAVVNLSFVLMFYVCPSAFLPDMYWRFWATCR